MRRRIVLTTVATIVSTVIVATPADAHHPLGDPEPISASAIAKAAPTSPTSPGLSLPLVLVSSFALVLLAFGLWARRSASSGPQRRRRSGPALAVAGATAMITFAASLGVVAGPASATTLLLPDLISDEPEAVGPVEVDTFTGEPRLVLRFDGYVSNVGDGALEVSGNPQITDPADPAGVHQRARTDAGGWEIVETPLVQFESADGHNHFHLMEVARYSLWNAARTAEIAPAQKVGFCLLDVSRASSEEYDGPALPRFYDSELTESCQAGSPGTTDLLMGITAGWRDWYGADITFQWVDVSETAPGIYYLANEVDPFNRIVESDETNNQVVFAETPSVVPGYNAAPVTGISTDGEPAAVTLVADQFGSPGARQFEIVTPPDHGSLDVASGDPFTAPVVTYTPEPGYTGPDSFEYVARDATSAFPLTPTHAAVSVDVGGATAAAVEISGAPASLIVGTSADLTATVTGGSGPVVWSVDGVVGGDATVGTISPDGLFVAPAVPPPGAAVTVRAALAADPIVYDDVTIGIDPLPNLAPQVTTPADQASTVGEPISLLVEASDPDGDAFTFAAAGLPDGLAIHPVTGLITGAPIGPGSDTVTVTVDDGQDQTVVTFDWLVEVRPLIVPGAVGVIEGDTGSNTASLPVTLSFSVSSPVHVNWSTVGTTQPRLAAAGTDFVASSGVVTFAPGETEAFVEIEVLGDTLDEPPLWLGEWGFVSFSSPSANADLDVSFFGLGVFIIVDDD